MRKIKEDHMTNPEAGAQTIERPKGVIFFAQDLNIQLFLAREGDPELLLALIEAESIEDMAQVCRYLQTSLLQTRGVEKISEDASEATVVFENNERMRFYMAAEDVLGRLALDQAA
jgi:hypothetical protein